MSKEEKKQEEKNEQKGVQKNADKKLADLQEEIKVLGKKATDYLSGWQRAKADYLNLKKQIKEEQELFVKFANAEMLLNILPVVDNFERALEHLPQNLQDDAWINGIKKIHQQLQKLLWDSGCEEIKTKGKRFNPEIHEAVAQVDNAGEEGKIIEEQEKGYKLYGKLLRPAKVKVAK